MSKESNAESTQRPFKLESSAIFLESADAEAGRRKSLEAAEAFQRALEDDPENASLACGWLRCLRRAKAPSEATDPVIEALLERFPDSPKVIEAAGLLLCESAVAHASFRRAEMAVNAVARAVSLLGRSESREFLATRLIAAVRSTWEMLEEGRESTGIHDGRQTLVEAVKDSASLWARSVPHAVAQGKKARTSGREPMAPVLRVWMLVRRILRSAEEFEALATLMEEAIEDGVESEWLWDSRIEGLLGSGRPDEALKVARSGRKLFPRSDALGRRLAAVLHSMGKDAEALDVLEETALAARTPWAWRDLAKAYGRQGRRDQAIEAFRCGLAFEDESERGLTWGLHMDLADLLVEVGDEPEAAIEILLARDARLAGGWGIGSRIQSFMSAHGRRLLPFLNEGEATQEISETRSRVYREAHTSFMESRAVPARVAILKEAFGLLDIVERKTRAAFSPKEFRRLNLKEGMAVRAVLVTSYDRKRKRDGLRAVWIQPVSEASARR